MRSKKKFDPSNSLDDQRQLVQRLLSGNAGLLDAVQLAQSLQELDEWICNGGALPYDWREQS